MRRALAAVAGATIAVGLLTACGGSSTQTAEDMMNDALSGSASVQLDEDGGVKVEASDGTIEFGTGELPPTWPSEVPPPPGFEVYVAGEVDGGWRGGFQAPGDQMAAADAYVRDLMNRGFAVNGDIPLGANGMYGLVGNGYQVDMMAVFLREMGEMGDTTTVTMRITPLS
jgi:hypothetical protein